MREENTRGNVSAYYPYYIMRAKRCGRQSAGFMGGYPVERPLEVGYRILPMRWCGLMITAMRNWLHAGKIKKPLRKK